MFDTLREVSRISQVLMALYFLALKHAMSKSLRIDCFEVHELKLVLKQATQHEMKHRGNLVSQP